MIEQLLLDSCWGNWFECNTTEIIVFGIPSYINGVITTLAVIAIRNWLRSRKKND